MTGGLAGRTILLTRDEGLADELRARGARVRVAPMTRSVPVEAVVDPRGFDWIVYTSPRAVAYSPFPLDAGPRIACVGPSTARAVRERGGTVARLPDRPDAESLCAGLLGSEVMAGARVLFPCSDRALDTVERRLGSAGAEVVRLTVYRTEPVAELPPGILDGVEVVVFLAPSAVDAFVAAGGDLGAAATLAIGERTADAIRARGGRPEVAPRSDRAGVIEALMSREYRR